jgi:hypothetical protein
MPRTHNPAGFANVAEFTVKHIRSAGGVLLWTHIQHEPSGEALVDEDTYEDHGEHKLTALAWDEEGGDPRDGRIPSDDSYIRAALRDIGIAPDDEIGEPEPDASGIEGSVPDASWRAVRIAIHSEADLDPTTDTAGRIHDANIDDDETRRAVIDVATGREEAVTVGGGAGPEQTLTRADSPETDSPTRRALAEAIAVLAATGCPSGPETVGRLQAILDQRGCEHFDAAGDGSLTDLIDIIIDG